MATIEDAEAPESVEEAGALLGATITFYGTTDTSKTISPPKGTHSSFSTVSPIPSSELFVRLHTLRAFLRSAPKDTPLVAAPSLLAGVLMKLLGVSNKLASAPTVDPKRREVIPPMLSTPLRKLWVDCIVLCHSLGEGLSGNARINVYGFVRNMISLASLNPRTAKAAGGTRVAALEVIEGIMKDPKLSVQLASWAFDVTHLCQRALKSSGNGEPTYRIAAVRTACSVVIASRNAFMKTRPVEGGARLVLKGALDDKAILEMVKLLKTAINDKFVEVRTSAAQLAALLAPLVIHIAVKSQRTPDAAASPTVSLEDIMTLAFKNLDDASPECATAWAEALARCMSTAIEVGSQLSAEQTSQRDVEGGGAPSPRKGAGKGKRNLTRKGVLAASNCSTLPKSLKYLVSVFVKAGGELVAPKTGGSFSQGGRAVRLGFARSIIQLLRLQSEMQSIGEGRAISHKEAILIILSMVGNDIEMQLNGNEKGATVVESLDATSVVTPATVREPAMSGASFGQSSGNALFGQTPKVSHADAAIARLCTSRVLREGILNRAAETTQLAVLHEFVDLCVNRRAELKGNQLQVILTESSHLFARLGEAAHSCLEELTPALTPCLRHPDHGVRHESAVLCAAIASAFPSEGRRLVDSSIRDIQLEHAELMAIASSPESDKSTELSGPGRFRFGRRAAQSKGKKPDQSLKHQYAIHGMSLMVTMIVRDLPHLPGGLPIELLDDVMSSAEFLSSTYFNDALLKGSPSGVCTCVRAGFAMISGVLGTGPKAIAKHIETIFAAWQKLSKLPSRVNRFTPDHEMICVEALLSSVLSFLKNCSELLLSVPDALSQVSLVLEQLLPLFNADGKLGTAPENPAAASRLDSAKACIMEAFTWLPPGSYPMVADNLFGFAARHIQLAVENEVTCSILHCLNSKEDKVLDAASFSRAIYSGQAGGLEDLETDILARTAEAAHHSDRESALHFLPKNTRSSTDDREFLHSHVLGMFVHDKGDQNPPTVLHGVGTWQMPANPCYSAKIRLVDASIQAFAATFTLKSPKEQHNAMKMLESMVPPLHFQPSSRGMGAALTEQDRRGKSKDYSPSFTNVTAVLVSCLKALPVQESTHNVAVGIGPTWMTQAKDVLLNVFPCRSPFVRRAAAEGLAILSTLGVKEDAHFLQSAVLHSLDEVFQGSYGTGQARPITPAPVSGASATALLTLGCIQRTAYRIKSIRANQSRIRGSPQKQRKEDTDDVLPTLQMMIRVLPSTNCGTHRTFFGVRAYALHSFGLLVAYSDKLRGETLGPDELQLLKKLVGVVEDNFLAAWTTVSADKDQGNEAEKLSLEPCFLAVLLRLMTFLTPSLHHLQSLDSGIASRFSRMASVIVQCSGSHPTVSVEALAFYEVSAKYQELLAPHAGGLKYDEHPVLCSIPFLMANLTPDRPLVHPGGDWHRPIGYLSSAPCLRATLKVINALSASQILVAEWSDLKIVSLLFAALECSTGSRCFVGETKHRGIASPREIELVNSSDGCLEIETLKAIHCIVHLESVGSEKTGSLLLRLILLARSLVVGSSGADDDDDESETGAPYTVKRVTRAAVNRAVLDADPVFKVASPVRWQVKIAAVQMATIALQALERRSKREGSSYFNPAMAKAQCLEECREATANRSSMPESRLALHIGILVSMACVSATSTVDQTELRILQECAMPLLSKLINSFGSIPDPDQADTSVLHEHIPQISSCIKSALAAPDENEEPPSCRLFIAGCEALHAFLQCKMSSDKGVLKRVIRPALPSSDELIPFTWDSNTPEPPKDPSKAKTMNARSALLLRIGKLWTVGNIPLDDPDIMSMLGPGKKELGVYSAAIAIEGTRLLIASNLSLCGSANDSPEIELSCQAGFLYRHVDDIDDFVKGALAKKWAACAANAVVFLSGSIEPGSEDQSEIEMWLRKTVSLLFAGLSDAIALKEGATSKHGVPFWATGVDLVEITSSCLKGINALLAKPELLAMDEEWIERIEFSVTQISDTFLLPVLSIAPESSSSVEVEIVARSCAFLQSLANNPTLEITSDSGMLLSLLRPLECLERGSINLNEKHAALIVSACLEAVGNIISKPTTPNDLVKAMLNLVFASCGMENPENVVASTQFLLKECLRHDSVTLKDKSAFASQMVVARKFANWAVVVQANAGLAAKDSLGIMQGVLVDSTVPDQQVEAVAAIRELFQTAQPPNPLIGRVFCALGAEILAVFQMYGTLSLPKESHSKRTAVCTDCMKIALAGLQQFASDEATSDDDISNFLVAMFLAFIPVVRFNGLPNHPLPQGALSDPAVGRICAQAMVHVARVTPIPFKMSVTLMPEQDRAVLEFAVRAEMSGYANASAQAPVKKKLNLKGFKSKT